MQRAEFWGVIAALQASKPVHLGVDNANVVGHVGRVLAGRKPGKPLELLVDGDLIGLVQRLVDIRGPGTTAISKVKGHADEGLVRDGRVRELDKVGNDLADRAADLGRRRVGAALANSRKGFSDACKSWYPIVLVLHRFFIAISRTVVNDDGRGGLAPDPMVWSAGGKQKRSRPVEAVRDYAMLPGPQRLWVGGWFQWPGINITEDDVARWPFSPGCLVKLAAFLSSLSWPAEVVDWGLVVFHTLSFLYYMRGGLGRDSVLRSLFRNTGGLGVQFQCQLHPCALMLIYGSCAGILVICCVPWLGCLVA